MPAAKMHDRPSADVTVVKKDQGEVMHVGPLVLHVMEDGSNTDNRMGAIQITVPPRTPGPPQHWHQMHDETFLVLSGKATFYSRDTSVTLSVGDYIVIPPLAPHTFGNETDEPTVLYCSFTPAFYVNYFRLLQEMAEKNGGKLDREAAKVAMIRYATLQTKDEGLAY